MSIYSVSSIIKKHHFRGSQLLPSDTPPSPSTRLNLILVKTPILSNEDYAVTSLRLSRSPVQAQPFLISS